MSESLRVTITVSRAGLENVYDRLAAVEEGKARAEILRTMLAMYELTVSGALPIGYGSPPKNGGHARASRAQSPRRRESSSVGPSPMPAQAVPQAVPVSYSVKEAPAKEADSSSPPSIDAALFDQMKGEVASFCE